MAKGRGRGAVPAGEDHAAGSVVLVGVLWALVHSTLASKRAKYLARGCPTGSYTG